MTKFQIIKDALEQTRKGCAFKEAWIPKGYACVDIIKFSRELDKKLK